MADFNVGLNAPQASGARPVEPVQSGSALAGTDNLFNMIGKGISNMYKKEAQEAQLSVIKDYSAKMGSISDAIASGAYNASRGASESRKLTTQFAAQYPEYVDELKKIHTFFITGTETGKAIEQESDETKRRGEMLSGAAKAGFPLFKGMSPETEDVIIQAYQNQERAKQLFDEQRKYSEEFRAESRFQRDQQEASRKEAAVSLLNEISKSQVTSFQAFSQELGKKVRSGGIKPEEAKMMLDRQMSQLRIGIDTVARSNPELAASSRDILENLYKIGTDYIDPSKPAKEAEDAYNLAKYQGMLQAITSDPRIKNLAVASALFGPSPSLTLAAAGTVNKVLNMSSDNPSAQLPVLGTPDEQVVIGHLREAVRGLQVGKSPDKEKALREGGNSANFLLKEVGQMMNTGEYNAGSLGEVGKFLATPEYLFLSKNGQISAEAAEGAKAVFQKGLYEPAAKQAAQKLNEALSAGLIYSYKGGGRGNQTSVTKYEPWEVREMVDIKFDGSSVVFVPKNTAALDKKDAAALREKMNDLKNVSATMTTLLKSYAHLGQSDDYAGTFEKVKHILFPYYYSQYSNLEIGDIKKGPDGKLYRYAGGDAGDGNNWKPTGK